jgi:hypothetical protein
MSMLAIRYLIFTLHLIILSSCSLIKNQSQRNTYINHFQKRVSQNLIHIKECTRKHIPNQIKYEKIKFNLNIKINYLGQVEDINSSDYPLDSKELLACVQSVFLDIQFKELQKNKEVILTQPIIILRNKSND